MTDNKKFWQTVKPFFSDKVKAKTVIKSVENDEMIDEIICKYLYIYIYIYREREREREEREREREKQMGYYFNNI